MSHDQETGFPSFSSANSNDEEMDTTSKESPSTGITPEIKNLFIQGIRL